LLLGYSRDPKLSKVKTYAAIENLFNYEKPNIEASYLSIYATIEPPLLVPEPFSQTFDSNEKYEVLELSSQWCTNLAKKFPTREFQTTVMDSQGKAVFITRYFKGLSPPDELVENGSYLSFETAQNVARFVYLIPFVSDTLLFPGLCDIWNTCDQFMETLAGDEEEHAVLLTNFFLGLGKKAWLVIGSSITGGSSAFCLSEENAELNIWFNGKPYKVKEAYNPVKRISMIVNAENVWANIQVYDQPFRMFFDLNNTSHWLPFFSKSTLKNQFPCIQPDHINFKPTNKKSVQDLESKLEAKLKDTISKWRIKHTRWNRNASTALRHILPKLETFRGETINTEPEELNQILNSYTMSGFPINLPYTDINSIFDAVYATQIHNTPSKDAEFALAVHIHAYPNTVLSVWVYVVSLIRKK
jgi:coiled-coil and C2 domain-containing protein 2A